MSVLSALAARHTGLSGGDVDHLHRLLGEWQLLADLGFADCLLFAPVVGESAFVVLAQVRPYPAQTLYQQDMVGAVVDARQRPRVTQALGESRIVREGDPEWRDGTPIREEAIPVVIEGRAIAVVSAEVNLATARTPSHLELSYLRAAGDLAQMIADGIFPFAGEMQIERELSPRVGDGFLEIDGDMRVTYASPNAVSAYRRLGATANIVDEPLASIGFGHRVVLDALEMNRAVEDEVEANGAWVLRRFLPVVHGGKRTGAIGLIRDITESRRRDRMLSIKDATIREIHHRVKNNLQTVASLLRMQARRLGPSEAGAALEASVRRISSIALVYETLSRDSSERVAFDSVVERVLAMVQDSLISPDRPVKFVLTGSAGELAADVATPLSLIVTELIQNAVEHAFGARGGVVSIDLACADTLLRVVVQDDGVGLPPEFSLQHGSNLGLQIVRTLVTELGGLMTLTGIAGTRVELTIPLESS